MLCSLTFLVVFSSLSQFSNPQKSSVKGQTHDEHESGAIEGEKCITTGTSEAGPGECFGDLALFPELLREVRENLSL
jgi:hypothetical protein